MYFCDVSKHSLLLWHVELVGTLNILLDELSTVHLRTAIRADQRWKGGFFSMDIFLLSVCLFVFMVVCF